MYGVRQVVYTLFAITQEKIGDAGEYLLLDKQANLVDIVDYKVVKQLIHENNTFTNLSVEWKNPMIPFGVNIYIEDFLFMYHDLNAIAVWYDNRGFMFQGFHTFFIERLKPLSVYAAGSSAMFNVTSCSYKDFIRRYCLRCLI